MTTQSVETSTGFHIHGTIAGTGRIDWSDGTYTLIDSVDRFAFNAVGKGTTTFSETHVDSGDFYSADGVLEFRQTFHEVEHFTEINGIVRVDSTKGHLHLFGDCRAVVCPRSASLSGHARAGVRLLAAVTPGTEPT